MHRPFLACLLALPFVLVVSSSGCTDQACIQWSEDEGPCPSRSEAIKFMIPANNCSAGGKVVSVDSEGEFDGQACCYDVTNREDQDDVVCGTSVGVGPGTSVGVTTGVGAAGGAAPTCFGESCQPECGAEPEWPSFGQCVTVDNFRFFCNPITNAGCGIGITCDLFFDGFSNIFSCSTSIGAISCTPCFASGECEPGYSCLTQCAKFCCDDSDCGLEARCSHEQFASLGFAEVGVCVVDTSTGGAGGAGGVGGVGGAGGAGGQGGGI